MIAETPRYYVAIGLVRFWKPALIGLAILAAFLYGRCGNETNVEPVGTADTVMPDMPEAKPTFTERIVYQQVPVEREVVVLEIDTLIVREFVEAAADSLRPQKVLGQSIEYDGEKLLMYGVRSDGARTFEEYDVRPTFKAGWAGDSTWAREERLARFPTMKVAAGTAVVAGVIVCLIVCR